MSTGFAGSRSMDERRRRRLASESSESLEDMNNDSDSPRLARTHRYAAGQFPLRTLIFPRRWKLSLFYLPVLLCFSALIAADYYKPQLVQPETALFDLLTLKSSPLLPLLGGALLFVSGQTALLIAAVRTQSLHDFSGRYRLWKWIACGLFLFALCQPFGMHKVWSQTVLDLKLFDWGPHTHLLAWLLPALVFGCGIAFMAYLEMRGDRAGLNLFILAGAAYVLNLTFMFAENLVPGEAYHHLIDAGLLYFAHWCLFTSLLLHTHHLLYRSVDLPEKSASRFKKVASGYLYRRRIKRKARRVAKALQRKNRLLEKEQIKQERAAEAQARQERLEKERAEKEQIKKEQAERKAAEAKAASKPEPTATPQNEKTPAEKPSEPVETPQANQAESAPEPSQRSSRKKAKSAGTKTRVDSRHDPEQLKGLSKRERRKLQKQWREEERRLASEQAEDWE